MDIALSILRRALVALKRDTVFRSANNKALESKGHCLWIWMVLPGELLRKQPYCRALQGSPWLLQRGGCLSQGPLEWGSVRTQPWGVRVSPIRARAPTHFPDLS